MTERFDSRFDRPRAVEQAGQAGFLAALVMVAVQLVWRLNWSRDGVVQAFPEFIVAAIARLTPLSVFGAATENYGSLAKKLLLVTVVLGIAAVGMWGGRLAGRLTTRTGTSFAGRLAAGLVVAALLLLFTLLVIMPIAHLGVFATQSSYTADILIQLVATGLVYAVVWACFTSTVFEPEPDFTQEQATRRAFLLDGATLVSMAVAAMAVWRLVNPRMPRVSDTAAQQSVDDIVATQRAGQGYELKTPTPRESASLTNDLVRQADDPLALFAELDAQETISPVLTAIPDFYHVSKNIFDPTLSADGWTLKIAGMVDNELEFTHDQLVERATLKQITTLCCISNQLNGDLIGTAQWTAVPLLDLLNEAGVQPGAVDLKFHAADDYSDSVSIDVGMSPDNLVVVGMNGETLPTDHGFPARLIIPNIYGMKNVKWLDRIEIVDEDFKGYWQTQGWSDSAVIQIWGRIDFPAHREEIDPGQHTLAGVATAGTRG
ncbi:MAG: molybdopterin-dependent oxidoreductase, partial [Thermomicrobiales bacterium]|nr:molybdopterin-dependent oxidoreductase [Thermomicrobiales bacterium]